MIPDIVVLSLLLFASFVLGLVAGVYWFLQGMVEEWERQTGEPMTVSELFREG